MITMKHLLQRTTSINKVKHSQFLRFQIRSDSEKKADLLFDV